MSVMPHPRADAALACLAGHGGDRHQGRGFSSDLSVDEAVLLKEIGYEPRGLVVGSAVYHIGIQYANWNTNQEMSDLTHAMYQARQEALTSMERHAEQVGGQGVVGLKLEVQVHSGGHPLAEFVAMGTAVANPDQKARGIWVSDLSGQDLYLLIRAGYQPIGLAFGACVYHVAHQGLGQWVGQQNQNVELGNLHLGPLRGARAGHDPDAGRGAASPRPGDRGHAHRAEVPHVGESCHRVPGHRDLGAPGGRRAPADVAGAGGDPRRRGRPGERRAGSPRRRIRGLSRRSRMTATPLHGPRVVHAPRGGELSCRGWPQEAAMRMLMNNVDPEIAEHPDQLIVYGGGGKAARSWAAFDAIVTCLRELRDDETLLVQSGKPVGVFRTHEWAPRVLIANANLVPDWATWDEFRRLDALGLTMYGQMTAGSWIYIGTQGILQGTYETFAAVAAKRFGGTLAGTDHPHRRARRDGRGPAAGGDHE